MSVSRTHADFREENRLLATHHGVFGHGQSQLKLAAHDIVAAVHFWPLWVRLGWYDIVQRYRRSLLGPFWLTASMAVMVISLGVIYAKMFKIDIDQFMPFLCVGLLAWGFIGSVLTEAGGLFTNSESYIKQIRLPFSVYIYRFIWSRLIIFAHNFIIYFGILAYFQISPGWAAFLALPGLLLLVINAAFTSIYLGMVSARFRDVPQIINSVIQIVFFVTPIFWKPEMLGTSSPLIAYNPFYHLVEILRAPLLGQIPSLQNFIAVAAVTLFNLVLATICFARFRSRIAYWV